MTLKSISPTREFLERAYNRLHKADWLELDFELLHPIRGKVLRGLAIELQRHGGGVMTVNPPVYANPKTPPPPPKKGPQPLKWDRKRLASGERPEPDDDDT